MSTILTITKPTRTRTARAAIAARSATAPSARHTTADRDSEAGDADALQAAIREAAYRRYLERAGGPGDEIADWLAAEAEVLAQQQEGAGPDAVGRAGNPSSEAPGPGSSEGGSREPSTDLGALPA